MEILRKHYNSAAQLNGSARLVSAQRMPFGNSILHLCMHRCACAQMDKKNALPHDLNVRMGKCACVAVCVCVEQKIRAPWQALVVRWSRFIFICPSTFSLSVLGTFVLFCFALLWFWTQCVFNCVCVQVCAAIATVDVIFMVFCLQLVRLTGWGKSSQENHSMCSDFGEWNHKSGKRRNSR